MQGVTESMAGRAAIFQLLPFSQEEFPEVSLLKGGFPEALARPSLRETWFRSYVQTYLERDVRSVTSIRDLSTFRRFLALVASWNGQILNKTDIAAPLGVSVPTVTQWLSILEITSQILLIPPFYENFGKRITKSPKLCLMDSGLACHLLGITNQRELDRSPFLGSIFEGWVASEIIKHCLHRGRSRSLYHFRDHQGLEVDFILDEGNARLSLIEAKASKSPLPKSAHSLQRLGGAVDRYAVRKFVAHRAQEEGQNLTTLRPGVKAVPLNRLSMTFWRR